MSLNSEKKEIDKTVDKLLDNLSLTISSKTGRLGLDVRHQIGRVRADYMFMLDDGTFPAELLACFTFSETAGAELRSFFYVHEELFNEEPVGNYSKVIVQMAISFCLAVESRIISAIDFTSRDDVEAMMKKVRTTFETAKDKAADAIDSDNYQKLTSLAGALTNHLATKQRPLPRMITFTIPATLSALVLSNRLYYDPNRWEELVDENRVVHPAFMPRSIKGLSA